MSNPNAAGEEAKRDRQQELAELINRASKQPGIKQLMDVYEHWKPFDAIASAHKQYLGIHRVVVVSNSSWAPCPGRTERCPP